MSAEMGGARPSGSKRAVTVATAVTHMLKTPTAQLAINGGSQHPDKRKSGGHGPTLADQVEHTLLPTQTAGSKAHPGISLTDALIAGNSTTPRKPRGDLTGPLSPAGASPRPSRAAPDRAREDGRAP